MDMGDRRGSRQLCRSCANLIFRLRAKPGSLISPQLRFSISPQLICVKESERHADIRYHAPYALSAPGNLEAALAEAGLRVVGHGEVVCSWRYACMDDAVRALLCSAGGARAIQAAGERAVRAVLADTLAQFQDPRTRIVTLQNTFRWVSTATASRGSPERPRLPAGYRPGT
jgi:hypothetical protein